ncbi:hypothetical protein H5410_020522 [Solanum commersonii]|uniref:Uncharacterized protein n=1 Tax=Solanum commersonii TaxID=4109 RepID=A0A9J5Z8N8_SOLCO|nr:hypothetical protein H5410_020522 [Solanum commersonii]
MGSFASFTHSVQLRCWTVRGHVSCWIEILRERRRRTCRGGSGIDVCISCMYFGGFGEKEMVWEYVGHNWELLIAIILGC